MSSSPPEDIRANTISALDAVAQQIEAKYRLKVSAKQNKKLFFSLFQGEEHLNKYLMERLEWEHRMEESRAKFGAEKQRMARKFERDREAGARELQLQAK